MAQIMAEFSNMHADRGNLLVAEHISKNPFGKSMQLSLPNFNKKLKNFCVL